MKRIVVRPFGDKYHAHLAPDTRLWASGKTPFEATGNLIHTHPEQFGVEIIMASSPEQSELIDRNTPPLEAPAPGNKWVKNLVGGAWIQIPEGTPLCCDPSSERYWSM